MPVSIKGTGGGSVTLSAAAAATDTTLTLPNTTGTILQSGTAVTVAQGGTGVTSTGAAGNVLFTTDGSTWSATQKIVQGTAVASTSGTSIDFTSIPSWVKRVTVMFNGVSTSGTSIPQIQIGSGSVSTTSYNSTASYGSTAGQFSTLTSGFPLSVSNVAAAASVFSGVLVLNLIASNTWVAQGCNAINTNNISVVIGGVSPALGGALDRVRITTVNGTDTFDAGSINILYE